MAGINKVIVVGRLGADPEMKAAGSSQVTRLSIATSENWIDRDGQKQERTEWHRVVVWGKLAELCSKHLSKGRQVYIEGRLQTRSWDDPQGQKRYSTEIVANTVEFLGGPSDQQRSSSSSGGGGERYQRGGASHAPASQAPAASDDFGFGDFAPEPAFDKSEELPF